MYTQFLRSFLTDSTTLVGGADLVLLLGLYISPLIAMAPHSKLSGQVEWRQAAARDKISAVDARTFASPLHKTQARTSSEDVISSRDIQQLR